MTLLAWNTAESSYTHLMLVQCVRTRLSGAGSLEVACPAESAPTLHFSLSLAVFMRLPAELAGLDSNHSARLDWPKLCCSRTADGLTSVQTPRTEKTNSLRCAKSGFMSLQIFLKMKLCCNAAANDFRMSKSEARTSTPWLDWGIFC